MRVHNTLEELGLPRRQLQPADLPPFGLPANNLTFQLSSKPVSDCKDRRQAGSYCCPRAPLTLLVD